jgi:hypothetical protein
VPSRSAASRLAGLVLLGGCAASAPALPPDTTSLHRQRELSAADFTREDTALSCDDIVAERQRNDEAMRSAHQRIELNRKNNQVAGYIGAVIFPPAYLATEGNYAEKDEIQRLYGRQDTLIKLAAFRACPTPR